MVYEVRIKSEMDGQVTYPERSSLNCKFQILKLFTFDNDADLTHDEWGGGYGLRCAITEQYIPYARVMVYRLNQGNLRVLQR